MESTEAKVMKLFGRHLVPIAFGFEKDGHRFGSVVTAFALSVSGRWFLITAGHWMPEIKR